MTARGAAWLAALGAMATGLVLLASMASRADRVADVRGTPHNLSVTGPGAVRATSESQVCVFCHTPHAATNEPAAPLWNRQLSGATYTPYASSSLDADPAELAGGPGGNSRLCLSCHDGTIALGNVNVLGGTGSASIDLAGTAAGGTMPAGAGTTTGFTRNLGVDLSNDHPISFTFDAALATIDGELRAPDGVAVGTRVPGSRPLLPLQDGQLQCTTCHDPHLRETDPALGSGKFLRSNRFQRQPPAGGGFNATDDSMCLACHDKAGLTWATSAHANPATAEESYSNEAAAQRDFPNGLEVWQAGCLNCHDTHSVSGSRRLTREGTSSPLRPKAGGAAALEHTCYQCHTSAADSVLSLATQVPDIRSDFLLPRRMPIDLDPEVHDIGTGLGPQAGRDMVESPTLLGRLAPQNRHAECTDCHNPHRAIKNRLFNANAAVPDAAGTHDHSAPHSNVASGALRGTTGVEPVYGAAAFLSPPVSYQLKRGDAGFGAGTGTQNGHVTREYQICLKCHSDYAFDTPPDLGASPGGTPPGTNGLQRYTDQAMELQAPDAHRGEVSTTDSGAAAAFATNNHRSWHPVIGATGRGHAERGTVVGAFRQPWGDAAGTQTMYCSDCHGSSTPGNDVTPFGGENGSPWGPHGSTNGFILKGEWSAATGASGRQNAFTANALCFKCHEAANYADRDGLGNPDARTTGFYSSDKGNLHALHTDKIERLRCTWCHVAVPHGWKNKALLVNLNDVGPEVGLPPGTQVRNNTTAPYSNAPYYLNSVLKIRNFARSGSWTEADCGSRGAPGNGEFGRDWMRDSSENCVNLP